MKRITFLMLHLNYGGLEKQTITLVNELAKLPEYKIKIISVYDLLNGKSFYEVAPNVQIEFLADFGPHHIEFYDALKHFKIFKLLKETITMIRCGIYKTSKLKKCIKSLDTDIIISSRIEFSKLIKRRDTYNISQEHSHITSDKYIKKVKRSFRNTDSIVVMTNVAKNQYEKWLKESNSNAKVYNISNMIDKTEVDDVAKFENEEIISVGRLEKVKDFPTLIDVFEKVHKVKPNIKLKIVGEGSQREKIEKKINELNLSDSVCITGRVDSNEVKNELKKASIFILSSVSESFSLVLCEAMECGLPCFSFDIEVGPKEIISDGYNGFLIENRNVDLMAQKVIDILNNKEKWQYISSNAQQDVKKYHSENIAKEWIELINKGEKK